MNDFNTVFELINETLEEGGVELESWRISDIVVKITGFYNQKYGVVED